MRVPQRMVAIMSMTLVLGAAIALAMGAPRAGMAMRSLDVVAGETPALSSGMAVEQSVYLPLIRRSVPPTPTATPTLTRPTPTVTPTLTPPALTPQPGAFALVSLSAYYGDPGSSVTLHGRGFGTDQYVVDVVFGSWMQGQITHFSDTEIQVTVPQPWGEPSWDGHLATTVRVDVGGSQSNSLPFEITNIPASPPLLGDIYPRCADIGESVTIDGQGFSPWAADNLVSFNGATAAAQSYAFRFDPHHGSISVIVPSGATTGDVRVRRLDGLNEWSGGQPMTIRPAVELTLSGGLESEGILEFYDIYGSWLLGGSGFSQVSSPTTGEAGRVDLYVTTANGTHMARGYAISDTQLAVPEVPREAIEGLPEGALVTLHAKGLDCGRLRESNALSLPFRKLHSGTYLYLPVNLTLQTGYSFAAASKGDYVCFTGWEATVWDGPVQEMRAPGLWEGTLPFQRLRLQNKCFPVREAGTYTIHNDTNGKSLELRIKDEGAIKETGAFALWSGSHGSGTLAEDGATMGFGGARLVIPPGALPLHEPGSPDDTPGGYYIVGEHFVSSAQPLSQQQNDGGHQFRLAFYPEPPELLKPITIVLPFSDAGRPEPPQMGFWDSSSALYYVIEGQVDSANLTLTYALPAGTYSDEEGASSSSVGASLAPSASLGRLTNSMAPVSPNSTTMAMEDPDSYFRVIFYTDPTSSDFASSVYARTVLDTLVRTRNTLVSAGWKWPAEQFTVTIEHQWWPGTTGSTTKGVFGRPSVSISNALGALDLRASTTAHELGHAFQREYTTNFLTKWIDEACAEWAAWYVLGADGDLEGSIHAGRDFPTVSMPEGFYLGYSSDQGYAAGAFAIWLSQTYGPDSIRKIYETLEWSPSYWYDSYATFTKATGAEMRDIIKAFSPAYWTQSYEPVTPASLPRGLPYVVQTVSGWAGVTVGGTDRPSMSSQGYSVGVADAWRPTVASRKAVARATGLGPDQYVHIYGDTGAPGEVVGSLTPIGELGGYESTVIDQFFGSYTSYRLVFVNASEESTSASVQLVVPHLAGLSPSSGSKDGDYQVTLNGNGFGPIEGTVTVGSTVLLPNDPSPNYGILSWSDTQIVIGMPSSSSAGPVEVKVKTDEEVWTEGVTFQYQ